jgi:hypothetical protein
MAEAVVTGIFTTSIAVGAQITAQRMQRRNMRRGLLDADTGRPTLAQRGVWLPRILGTYRLPGIVKWTGERHTHGGHGGKDDDPLRYHERVLTFLGVGPMDELHAVYRNNDRIWPREDAAPLLRADNDSGVRVDTNTKDDSFFHVYWGELRQPVNTDLHAAMAAEGNEEVATRYPNVTYVDWKYMVPGGSSPQHGQFEYVGRWKLLGGMLTSSAPWIEAGPLGGSGVNPAHAFCELACAPRPHGLGLPLSLFDGGLLEEAGALCEAEGLAANLIAADGIELLTILTDFMDEVGLLLTHSGTQLRVYPLRAPTVVIPEIGSPEITDPRFNRRWQQGKHAPSSTYGRIMDETNGYRPSDLALDDDNLREEVGERPASTLFRTVTNRRIAHRIMERRDILDARTLETAPINVHRSARNVVPGQAIEIAGGTYLCLGARIKPGQPDGRLDLASLLDTEGSAPPPGDIDEDSRQPGSAVAADSILRAIQLPLWAAPSGDRPYTTLLRARANKNVAAAEVWVSANGTTYAMYGRQDLPAAVGALNRPILVTEVNADLQAEPPWVTPTSLDWDYVPWDLTGNDAEYEGGGLMALIDDELFFARTATLEEGGYALTGLTRARSCTVAAAHAPNAIVWLFRKGWQTPLYGSAIAAGGTAYHKSRPLGLNVAGDLSASPVAEADIAAPACPTP